jgi:ribosome maturation factor RimP
MVMDKRTFIENTLLPMGFELIELELIPGGGLRLFMDTLNTETAVSIEDCVAVSNHLQRLFLVENIDYSRLDVSSPGLDRPLKKEADYVRFVGQQVKIKIRLAMDGQKKFQGTLMGLEGDQVLLSAEGTLYKINYSNIEKARLVPVFD